MKIIATLALIFVTLVPSLAVSETAEEKGKAIAEEADRRDLGWKDNKSVLIPNIYQKCNAYFLQFHLYSLIPYQYLLHMISLQQEICVEILQ